MSDRLTQLPTDRPTVLDAEWARPRVPGALRSRLHFYDGPPGRFYAKDPRTGLVVLPRDPTPLHEALDAQDWVAAYAWGIDLYSEPAWALGTCLMAASARSGPDAFFAATKKLRRPRLRGDACSRALEAISRWPTDSPKRGAVEARAGVAILAADVSPCVREVVAS
jgi:hypothetical protein